MRENVKEAMGENQSRQKGYYNKISSILPKSGGELVRVRNQDPSIVLYEMRHHKTERVCAHNINALEQNSRNALDNGQVIQQFTSIDLSVVSKI